jgi:hypothetical protein
MRNFFLISLRKWQPQKLTFPGFPKYGVNTHNIFSLNEVPNQVGIEQDFSLDSERASSFVGSRHIGDKDFTHFNQEVMTKYSRAVVWQPAQNCS